MLVDGQGLGDEDLFLVPEHRDQSIEGGRLAAADEPDQGQQLAAVDRSLDVGEDLLLLLGLEVAGPRQVSGQAIVLHHVAAHVILRARV
jgi:hypothetical protein